MSRDAHRSLLALNRELEGEVSQDTTDLLLYASDASLYQEQPLAVAFPKNANDCRILLQYADAHGIAIIPRAGGTSLAGQVVGHHLVVDVSRYLTKILDIDVHNATAQVQAGVVPAILNQRLAQHQLMFAPDPSTLDRCNIAGMIGNNAWGAHCPTYGTTREHILELQGLLSNGDHIHCAPLTEQGFRQRQSLNTAEGRIYQALDNILQPHRQQIIDAYPPITEVPCNAGYALHILSQLQPWNPPGDPFNLGSLICGSEGTLAFVTEAQLRLTPQPAFRRMICAHFDSLEDALCAVTVAHRLGANAIELLDRFLLRLAQNQKVKQGTHWIIDEPAALLLIEFTGSDNLNVTQNIKACIDALRQEQLGSHFPVLEQEETQSAWNLRRASLGYLMGVTSQRKPVTFIEDSAVPIQHLPHFVNDVQQLMTRHQLQCVYYGSVSMGLIHLRPLLDLQVDADIDLFKKILAEVATLLKRYHGTLTAKHGDGIVRSPYIRTMLGEDIWRYHQQIKQAFDPHGTLNPGKITDIQAIDTSLRVHKQTYSNRPDTFYSWQPDGGIYRAIYKCNGAGACRKLTRGATMCPSFRATQREIDTTRGRANIYRQVIQDTGFEQGIVHPSLSIALQHCLACKACKTECPANVDMAKLKSEHAYQRIKRHGKTTIDRLILHFEDLSRVASVSPMVFNHVANSRLFKTITDIHRQRQLPKLAPYTLSRWFKRNRPHGNAEQHGVVALLCDPFTQYYDVDAGVAAIEVLERLGYRVLLTPPLASLRTVISQGLLTEARARLIDNINALTAYVARDIPIVGLEPSEVLTYRDDIRDINISRDFNKRIIQTGEQVRLFDEFVQQELAHIKSLNLSWSIPSTSIHVHAHCHQKALIGLDATLDALSLISHVAIQTIPSGCCGMAGFFGYQSELFPLSQQIAELELFPAIRQMSADTIVVATGTSCRHQIADGLHRKALHTAQVLRMALPE